MRGKRRTAAAYQWSFGRRQARHKQAISSSSRRAITLPSLLCRIPPQPTYSASVYHRATAMSSANDRSNAHTPTLPRADQSASRLMSLPIELRLIIRRMILLGDTSADRPFEIDRNEFATVDPRVLVTCKQVHTEATPILYRENCFKVMIPLPGTWPFFSWEHPCRDPT